MKPITYHEDFMERFDSIVINQDWKVNIDKDEDELSSDYYTDIITRGMFIFFVIGYTEGKRDAE